MMWKENDKTTDKRIERITKDKTKPAPGEYDDPKAWKSSVLGNREYTLSKGARINFTEIYKNKKKYIPGPATHKYGVETFSKLSKSPKALKIHRH